MINMPNQESIGVIHEIGDLSEFAELTNEEQATVKELMKEDKKNDAK
jgi:hypothetical protein